MRPYAGHPVGPPPVRLLCTSFDNSGWSNNAAMFRRDWWLRVNTSPASLTTEGNGWFELNAMFLCNRRGPGVSPGDRAAQVCQLWPGITTHKEVDGR